MDTSSFPEQRLFARKGVAFALLAVLVLLALFLLAKTLVTFKEYHYVGGGVPAATTITVSGMGEVFTPADTTQFTFSVVEEGASVAVAQQKATDKMNQALAIVKAGGVEDKNTKTLSYDIHPKYEQVVCVRYPCPTGDLKIIGFESSQTIEIKLKDAQKAGDLISQLAEIGVQNVSGLSFTVEDEEAMKVQARAKAVENAKTKAQTLADTLGVDLVRIVSFAEEGQGMPYFAKDMDMAVGMGGAEAAQRAELPQGQNKITSNISITYEIR